MPSAEAGALHLEDPVRRRAGRRLVLGAALAVLALAVAILLSLACGANPIPPRQILEGLLRPDSDEASLVARTLRVPRTVTGLLAGVAFGLAGAVVQALTRNPLADPGILGVNAGAGLAVTIGAGLLGVGGISTYMWFAVLGAALATAAVHLIGSGGRGAASPVTLVLAGVALSAVLGGISTALTLLDPETFRALRAWGLGSLARTSLADTAAISPLVLTGVVLAALIAVPMNSLSLGEDLAAALGTSIVRTHVLGVLTVTLLAGAGTALTGGIAFVGLMVPHVVRWVVGPDQRWIFLGSALLGPILVLLADIIGRLIALPSEIEVGVLTALVGAPVLIALARRRTASTL
ncbi:FecCD family ABC transporter permease [Brachybacterium paraconglomeratum]|uniref:FecCD family ABC transporter permease n=1 Tax=Brachybacterium paraconglomeratum TaxID=173362 RepID=UPI003FD5C3FE